VNRLSSLVGLLLAMALSTLCLRCTPAERQGAASVLSVASALAPLVCLAVPSASATACATDAAAARAAAGDIAAILASPAAVGPQPDPIAGPAGFRHPSGAEVHCMSAAICERVRVALATRGR
jgi:hypothetical protein